MVERSEQLRFDGRVAVVTGAGRGIGRAHALLLAQRGAAVVVNDLGVSSDGSRPDVQPAQEVAAEIADHGGQAIASTADISSAAGAEAIASAALDSFGAIDILVHNAAIFGYDNAFVNLDVGWLERQLSVNLEGSVLIARACWPALVGSSAARVILTSSSSLLGASRVVSYAAAKGGVLGLGRCLALIGMPDGIRVNVLFPGAETRMATVPGTPQKDDERRAAGVTITRDWERSPEHVAPVVAFLAHESCRATGEIFAALGGSVSRIVFSETEGYANPAMTPEDVRDNWNAIMDSSHLTILRENTDWSTRARARLVSAGHLNSISPTAS